MTRYEIDDLSDDELAARLTARTNAETARRLVDQRDDPHARIVIDGLVGE